MHLAHPFPYERLRRLKGADVVLLRSLSTWLDGRSRWACGELEPLLGAPLEVTAREVLPARVDRQVGEASQVVRLEHVDLQAAVMLEVDAPIASELVWLCLTGSIDPSVRAPRPLDRVEQGVLLYLVAQVVTSLLGRECALRVAGVGRREELAAVDEGGAVVHLLLTAGACFGHAWLHVPSSLGPASLRRSASLPAQGLFVDALGRLPAALHVVLGSVELGASQWGRARIGDVVVLDEVWTRPSDDGVVAGPVRLRLPLGRTRWAGSLSRGSDITIDAVIQPGCGVIMDQSHDSPPASREALLEEIPAELSIELGRIALTAHDALSLRPGHTLRLKRRPGDLVEVRIGPTLVARGELVVVEGELGVLLREVLVDQRP